MELKIKFTDTNQMNWSQQENNDCDIIGYFSGIMQFLPNFEPSSAVFSTAHQRPEKYVKLDHQLKSDLKSLPPTKRVLETTIHFCSFSITIFGKKCWH